MKGKKLKKIINKARLQAKIEFEKDSKDFNYSFDQNSDVDDCLDLHGHTKREAQSLVEDFISFALENGFSKVRIITGIGEDGYSVLRNFVSEYLRESGYRFNNSDRNRGGDGAFDVWL